jgi:hypothetical protein
MKQLSLAACILCVLVACNTATNSSNTKDTTATAETTATNENVNYAYPVAYSSDFTIGDSKYAQTVLELWKDFDNNTFDNHKDAFADSVAMDFADGTTMSGSRDSIIASAKAYRSSLKNVVSSVEVVTALKAKGKDETWVCVWGKEVDTHNNGKVDSTNLQENWMFNKDGKIAYMGQYSAKPAMPMKK